jgi:hypothetical protein
MALKASDFILWHPMPARGPAGLWAAAWAVPAGREKPCLASDRR